MKKEIIKIKDSIIIACRTRSFGFAFWGVLIFGSIAFGFLGNIYAIVYLYMDRFLDLSIKLPGGITLWGYLSLLYVFFSLGYLYRKASLLELKYCKLASSLIGVYISFSVAIFLLVKEVSILFFIGDTIYDLIFSQSSLVASLQEVSNATLRLSKCGLWPFY